MDGWRRAFIRLLVLAVLCVPRAAEAQQAGKVYRIGWLGLSTPKTAGTSTGLDAFSDGLRSQGFVEGTNVVIERRYSEGNEARNDEAAADFVRMRTDVIVATYAGAARAAKQATNSIPIVMVGGNPEQLGLVASLGRPGGNLTGVSNAAIDWSAKPLEILHEALPNRTRVAIFYNPDNPGSAVPLTNTDIPAAKALGLVAIPVEIRSAADVERAFEATRRQRAEAIYAHLPMGAHRLRILELARQHALPVIGASPDWPRLGGLLSYGPDARHLYARAAVYVARILNGAKPADLPVEQATRFELVVNLKTAKALGLTIPPSVLARADHIIE